MFRVLLRRAAWLAVGPAVLGLAACASAPSPLPPARIFVPQSAPPSLPPPAPLTAAPVRRPAASAPATVAAVTPPRPVESAAVAARFSDPALSYRTPAFAPGHPGFTSNAELRELLRGLVRDVGSETDPTIVRLIELGSSQNGVPLEALHFARSGIAGMPRAARPTVMLVGQQHGDEPAGAEALLVIAQQLLDGGPLASLLDQIEVVMLPRANPDGANSGRRETASGIDANRDHLLLRTPEAQAQAQLVVQFAPVVVVDAHEYTAIGTYLEKFGTVQREDAMIQYAMVANLPPFVTRAAEEWFRRPMLQSLKQEGLRTDWYYTTSDDLADRIVAMGSVRPDNGRNVNGLRHAVSLLIETRGSGLGRAHLLRRVHTQVVAITSALRSTAGRADDLLKLRHFVDQELAAKACQGELVVAAEATPSEYTLTMLDPVSGVDKAVNVSWESALALAVTQRRTRPCGYWLAADQLDAVLRLRGLGVQVQRLEEPAALRGETYRETARAASAAPGSKPGIGEGGAAQRPSVATAPALLDLEVGGYYVGLDQPLADLVSAALEPDTSFSFAAHRVIDRVASQARVMQRPAGRTSPVP